MTEIPECPSCGSDDIHAQGVIGGGEVIVCYECGWDEGTPTFVARPIENVELP